MFVTFLFIIAKTINKSMNKQIDLCVYNWLLLNSKKGGTPDTHKINEFQENIVLQEINYAQKLVL